MMTDLLLAYVLKVNIALAVLYLFYNILLRTHTFYSANRVYFLAALALAGLFPLVDFSAFFPAAPPLLHLPARAVTAELSGGARQLLLADYVVLAMCAGSVMLLARLAVQLISLHRLHTQSAKVTVFGSRVAVVTERVNPFSFFGWVFVNPTLHNPSDLRQIIAHEDVHIRQWHTADILLYEAAAVLCWYNPFMWLLRRAMKQNIEFLTDHQLMRIGTDKRQYQYTLLKVSRMSALSGIVNNFNFNDLKNRIAMMNKKQSPKRSLLKFAALLPVLASAALLVNANDIVRADEPKQTIVVTDSTAKSGANNNTAPATPPKNGAAIAFDKLEHDFGTIIEVNGETTTDFMFVNTGNKPLVVSNVTASCGCTTPAWTKEPVAPGGVGYIRATYNPAGRVYPFNRTLTVSTNGTPSTVVLHIKGVVVKK